MRILILGGDGYLGWPTAMHFAARGHSVGVLDNYLRRRVAAETGSQPLFRTPDLHQRVDIFESAFACRLRVWVGDCTDAAFLDSVVGEFRPEAIIHYAELPSAPYSMMGVEEARRTFNNNLNGTFNVIWSLLRFVPDCHLVKLGTMGEYGTPNIDIEEGWIEIEHNGRSDRFLFPRQGSSLYHTSKILDTDLLWFYVRLYGLRVTDLMQGPVYGLVTAESDASDELLPHFSYDDIFGTVLNRFLVQAVAGFPLTIYGRGEQTRGYINLRDTLQCVDLAVLKPAERGSLRILNQFTEQFTVNDLAQKVYAVAERLGMNPRVQSIRNPRKEAEAHYYKAANCGLLELGLRPHLLTDDSIASMLERLTKYRDLIDTRRILPRVRWNSGSQHE